MVASTDPENAKAIVAPIREALYNYDPGKLRAAVANSFSADALIQLAHPFETLKGPMDLLDSAIDPLASAFPDLERRDMIVLSGEADTGACWVGCCGYYTGTFSRVFLDIPPTGDRKSVV